MALGEERELIRVFKFLWMIPHLADRYH